MDNHGETLTKEDIIKMAQEADIDLKDIYSYEVVGVDDLERFYAKAFAAGAAAEREACAKVCESEPERKAGDGVWRVDHKSCAIAIRARGNK